MEIGLTASHTAQLAANTNAMELLSSMVRFAFPSMLVLVVAGIATYIVYARKIQHFV